MIIIVVILVVIIFWLGKQNQKSKPDYLKQDEFIYEYTFPFSNPSAAIKKRTSLKINNNNRISMSIGNKEVSFSINRIVKEAFHKQFFCSSYSGEKVIFTLFENGARFQDDYDDLKFTKNYPDSKHFGY